MADFSDLPTEIWLLIAWCIPKSQLIELKSLNTVFLNCWMDRSWTHVTIRADLKHDRILQRMAHPFVAKRTRKLIVDLSSPSSNINPSTLFRTIMSASFARLQELSLSGVAEQFALLSEYSAAAQASPFEGLMKLSLTLGQDPDLQTESTLPLEPFFRFLPPTLQLLKIMNFSSLNVMLLFDALFSSGFPACYPKIKFLLLETPLKSSCQSLHHFLLTHNNLEHLTLFLHATTDQERLDACLIDLVNNKLQFPSLQTLNICPSTTQTGLSAVLALIKRTAPTLSTLWIRFRCLTCEEARQVVNALTEGGVQVQAATATIAEEQRNLKSLRLRMTQLSVPFLNLLACKLPQLEKLDLRVSEIVGSDPHSFYNLLHQRRHALCLCSSFCPIQDPLHTWRLRDLVLAVPERRSNDAMHAVAGAVPTVVV